MFLNIYSLHLLILEVLNKKILIFKILVILMIFLISSCSTKSAIVSKKSYSEYYGLIGLISSLNPLIVSNIEFSYKKKPIIKFNGLTSNSDQLRVGHYVSIEYVIDNNINVPKLINVRHILIGPVLLSSKEDLISINQKIENKNLKKNKLKNLKPGQWIAVSGLRKNNSLINPSIIEILPSQAAGLLRGKISNISENFIMLGSSKFELRPLPLSVKKGDNVLVRYTFQNRVLKSFAITNIHSNYFTRSVRSLSIEGYIELGNDGFLRVSGFPYLLNNHKKLKLGDHVVLSGYIKPGRIFHIEKEFIL